MTLRLVRRYRFCAAHRYWREEWSEERNREVFGRCANPHGHGHNYRMWVELEGEPDPRTGFLVDLGKLDAAVEEVLEGFDHRHLNEDTPWFQDAVPTTENLALVLWERLSGRLPAPLRRLRLAEDEDLAVILEADQEVR